MSFQEFGLNEALQSAVARAGYASPTAIQSKAIPAVLAGGDLLAAAQTGTGKTAAFTLPLLHRLAARKANSNGRPRALVLTPTRELALQVSESVREYGHGLSLRSTVIFGGVSAGPQLKALRRGTDIIVATPGRLFDHLQQGHVDLARIETFVLDEADRMLDMGFIHDIKRIIRALPDQRQNLLFSATFSKDIRQLAKRLLNEPAEIDVAPRNSTTELVDQKVVFVAPHQKREFLSWMIGRNNWQQVLVFTRTKHGANRLCRQLTQDGLPSAALHGNKSQNARTVALRDFKQGKVRVLVATDIAARGLDIDLLPHVINFDLPNVSEDYVHRIGRTGRAGSVGEALSLVSLAEKPLLKDIQKLLGKTIPVLQVEDYHLKPEKASTAAPQPAGGNRSRSSGDRRNRGGGRGSRNGQTRHARPSGGRGRRKSGGRARSA